MSQRHSRRVLMFALAISLLLHVILALWLHLPTPIAQQPEPVRTTVGRVRIVRRVAVRPTPPPPRLPVVTHRFTPISHANVHLVRTVGTRGTRAVAIAPRIATPTPMPAPSPPGCGASNNLSAAIAVVPSPPDIPIDVRAAGTAGTTWVLVQLSADGTVTQAAVVQSSGNGGLDQLALAQARAATYSPALKACKAVPGEYTFKEKWSPW
jgi:TonB family protein